MSLSNKEISEDKYKDALCREFNVDWRFIPAASQWRDPAERLVKSIKGLFKSLFVHENAPVLTLNEFWGLFRDISEILNRRPITAYVKEDTVTFITPNSLLIGRPSKDPPAFSTNEDDPRARQRLIKSLTERFWKNLQNELIAEPSYFKANKWQMHKRVPQKNDIVLVLYRGKLSDNYRYGIVTDVIDERTVGVKVASLQSGSQSIRAPKYMECPVQRTVLLFAATASDEIITV